MTGSESVVMVVVSLAVLIAIIALLDWRRRRALNKVWSAKSSIVVADDGLFRVGDIITISGCKHVITSITGGSLRIERRN